MKKWNLIMSKKALENYLIPEHIPAKEKDKREKQNSIHNLLNEHRIVFSDSLLSILENQEDKDLYEELRDWIGAANYADGLAKAEECDCDSFDDWVLKTAQRNLIEDWQVVVRSEDNDEWICQLPEQKVYETDELLQQIISNRIIRDSKYCQMPLDTELDGKIIQEWLSELFEDETEIYIFDQFICNEKGYENFKNLYAKALKRRTVHLFVSQYELNDTQKRQREKKIDIRTQWDQLAKNNSMELVFHTSRDPEHDRYIFLQNDMFLYIGLGTDFLDTDTKKTREITMVHVVKGTKPSRDSICRKHPYQTSSSFNFNYRS